MPTFSLDRSPRLNQRQYSPQRAMRMGGLAAAGSLVTAVGIMLSGGGSSASGTDTTTVDQGSIDTTAAAATTAAVAPTTTVAPATTIAATTTTAAVCTNTYTVLSGDYWLLIAQEASITVDELYAANNATAATVLFPGQSICLPDGTTVVVTTTPATVATTAAPVATTATTVKTVTTAASATPATTPASSSHSS